MVIVSSMRVSARELSLKVGLENRNELYDQSQFVKMLTVNLSSSFLKTDGTEHTNKQAELMLQ